MLLKKILAVATLGNQAVLRPGTINRYTSMSVPLRYYQEESVGACLMDLIDRDVALLIAVTGAGKTLMSAAVIQLYDMMFSDRLHVVLNHRKDLSIQLSEDYAQALGGKIPLFRKYVRNYQRYDVESQTWVKVSDESEMYRSRGVLFLTVQSIAGDLGKNHPIYDVNNKGVFVIDECHHYGTKTGGFSGNSETTWTQCILDLKSASWPILGCTASPSGPNKDLKDVFGSASFIVTFQRAIESKAVRDPKTICIKAFSPADLDLGVEQEAVYRCNQRKYVKSSVLSMSPNLSSDMVEASSLFSTWLLFIMLMDLLFFQN